MKKIAAVFIAVLMGVPVVSAQQAVRTVTNSDLAKFRERRLAAEREYRENYERLGLPSPEELDEMRESDMEARLMLADQLRTARLERERVALENRRLNIEAERLTFEREVHDSRYDPGFYGYGGYGGFAGFGGFGGYGGHGFFDRGGRRNRSRLSYPFSFPTYRVTPVGVVFEPGSRSQQIWSPVPSLPPHRGWRTPRR
jgi:hypothetical protein